MSDVTDSGTNVSWVFPLMQALMFMFLLGCISSGYHDDSWPNISELQRLVQAEKDSLKDTKTKLEKLLSKYPECRSGNLNEERKLVTCSGVAHLQDIHLQDIMDYHKQKIRRYEQQISTTQLEQADSWKRFLWLPAFMALFLLIVEKWVPFSAGVLLISWAMLPVHIEISRWMMVAITVLLFFGHDRELWLLPRKILPGKESQSSP